MILNETNSFVCFDNSVKGLLFDESNHQKYPIAYYNVINGEGVEIKDNCSYYGYVYDGISSIDTYGKPSYFLTSGMYFTSVGNFTLPANWHSKMILIEVYHEKGIYPKTNFKSYFTIGGEVEDEGRLKYIDGCTDSLLIPPVKMGDPCFNHLHFPKDIDQTMHTHPSHRIGMVTKGSGICKTPFGNLDLKKDMIFIIKEWDGSVYSKGLDNKDYPNGLHAFKTTKKEGMDVVAFHPDSDFGATDVDHPMINRTIVDGVSASTIDDIRTK